MSASGRRANRTAQQAIHSHANERTGTLWAGRTRRPTEGAAVLAYITGAAGFIGSHLCDRLLREGWEVVGIDNLATGDRRNLRAAEASGRFRFVEADVAQPWDAWIAKLDAVCSGARSWCCTSPHRPARCSTNGSRSRLWPSTRGTMQAVALAAHCGAVLLYASTSESYGDPLEHPQRETYWGHVNPVGIRACYDESKRYGEAYVTTAVRKLGIDGRIARIFNTYGPRMSADDGRVIPNFCVAALRGQALTVYGDGSQTRSFCFVDDLVDAIVRFATRAQLGGRA